MLLLRTWCGLCLAGCDENCITMVFLSTQTVGWGSLSRTEPAKHLQSFLILLFFMAPHVVRAQSTYKDIRIRSLHMHTHTHYKYMHFWWWVGQMRTKEMTNQYAEERRLVSTFNFDLEENEDTSNHAQVDCFSKCMLVYFSISITHWTLMRTIYIHMICLHVSTHTRDPGLIFLTGKISGRHEA